eukprot:5832762-Prymnesium_polylepis.1
MAMRSARKAAVRPPSCEQCDRHGDQWSPCRYRSRRSRLGCSPSAPILRAVLRGPVAGGKPVSIMQNIADDLLDG